MRVVKSLLVAIVVFVVVIAITFVVGLVVTLNGQVPDPNGITSTTSPNAEALSSQISGIGVIAGIVLGMIGGIVYGVGRPSLPAPVSGPPDQ